MTEAIVENDQEGRKYLPVRPESLAYAKAIVHWWVGATSGIQTIPARAILAEKIAREMEVTQYVQYVQFVSTEQAKKDRVSVQRLVVAVALLSMTVTVLLFKMLAR